MYRRDIIVYDEEEEEGEEFTVVVRRGHEFNDAFHRCYSL